MEFPDSYFEDEVREGFFVAGMIKRAWAAQVEVLLDIDKVCKKNQITYFADFGTLLGAVRHQGFIPWDDDLDISMKREDYNRFLAAAKELPEGYYVRDIHTDDTYTELFARVLNSREINFEPEFLEKFHGCPYGMGIDVFVMDDLAPNPGAEEDQMQMISAVLTMIDQVDADISKNHIKAEKERIERALSIHTDSRRPLKNQLFLLLEQIFSMYLEQGGEEIAVMPLWIKNKKYRMKKAWYRETTELPFERAVVPAPICYNAVLHQTYGEYMVSQKMGGSHEYPLYRKQEEALKRQMGINPYTYVISKEDLNYKNTSGKMTVKKQIREFLQLLWELQEETDKIFSAAGRETCDMHGDWENAAEEKPGKADWKKEAVLEALTKCQETAISFGTFIESVKGEGTETVGRLESYCEEIYRIYEMVLASEEGTFPGSCDALRKQLKEAAKTCKKEIDLRHEIIFLPCRASEWDALESVWRAAKADPDCIVYVIPIPYFSRKSDGSFGEMHYEAELFPDDVLLTAYHTFDYENHCPDVMYIQNPYDAYNLAISVHPFFYSENLKKYTAKLVYLPPFVVNEITLEDQRAIENLKYCCIVPGMVYADKVIVQSEGMRQIYIQILTEAAGEETREIWKEKILGMGSPKMDQNPEYDKAHMDLPREWISRMRKPDGGWKKVVLYGTSAAVLLEHSEKILGKMKRVFDAFWEKREEICLLWAPDHADESSIKKAEPVLWEEYQKRMQQYREKELGILDCSGDVERAAAVCDAYYGDGGYAAQLCIRRKIPVMLQEVEG